MFVIVREESNVTTVLLNRPEKAHAYHRELLEELQQAIANIASPVVIIGSTGKTGPFCGGADLNELKSAQPEDARQLFSQKVFHELACSPFVSIAAIQGAAIAGGFELALACDLRVAGPNARFGLPEVSLGLIPAAGGSTRLPLLVGPARARQIILGGRELQAEEALNWGIVSQIAEDPLDAALIWATEIAGYDPGAIKMAKTLLDPKIEDRLEIERITQAQLYALRKD